MVMWHKDEHQWNSQQHDTPVQYPLLRHTARVTLMKGRGKCLVDSLLLMWVCYIILHIGLSPSITPLVDGLDGSTVRAVCPIRPFCIVILA